jgi:ABC-type multidrug transport system fused ATPase/permease subunit
MILALEAGHIAEIGTHDELIGREGGVYAKLYALQALDDRASREPQSEEVPS